MTSALLGERREPIVRIEKTELRHRPPRLHILWQLQNLICAALAST